MAGIIRLLPESIANQIAAGEVIQRPASVVKELMENSIDAGASSVKLIVKDAGSSLIQVTDDGCGMSEEDVRMSVERHATSKIRAIEDLYAIRTKGFRGEALASIASVARLEVRTRRVEDEAGTLLVAESSLVKTAEPCECAGGTSVSIKNLFFNIPARRHFLKSDSVEMRHIIEEFTRIALGHPAVFFSLHHNGTELYHLEPGNLRQRIVSVFGKSYNERLVPVNESTGVVKVTGFAGKPEFARRTRGESFLMVNERFIRNGYLNHAVLGAYSGLLQEGSFPFYLLMLEVNPSRLDVNVHPTKQEVKFEDEHIVYSVVNSAVKKALGQYSVGPAIDFDREPGFDRHDTFRRAPGVTPAKGGQEWHTLYETGTMTIPSMWPEAAAAADPREETSVRPPYQLHRQYIVSQIKSGMILIDQQAAHERILYEKYLKAVTESVIVSKRQLFPQTITLPSIDSALLKEILPSVQALGFDIQEFGPDTWVVRGFPSDIKGGDEQKTIEEFLERYKSNLSVTRISRQEALASALARNAAVKHGQKLGHEEMSSLIDELFACAVPNIAPGGKLTFITFTLEALARQFDKP